MATIQSLFPDTLGHSFEKIGEAAQGSMPATFGAGMVKSVTGTLQTFKEATQASPYLKDSTACHQTVAKLEYALDELHKHFTGDGRLHAHDVEIFLFFISEKMRDLKGIAKEADDRTEQAPR